MNSSEINLSMNEVNRSTGDNLLLLLEEILQELIRNISHVSEGFIQVCFKLAA